MREKMEQCKFCGLIHIRCTDLECFCGDKEPTHDGTGYNPECYDYWTED